MPRSSRHKTQRSRKHGDGELEGDASSRDRRVKQEEKDSAARVSAKSLSSKDLVLTSNGGEKKRKDRGEGSVVVVVDDRWNGGAEDEQVGEKKPKGEVFDGVDLEKGKGKGSESKSRSSRRQDGLSEGGESAKPKTEKESSRRDSSGSQYKSSKEREKDSGKDVKERDRDYNKESKERDRDYGRDVKEKDRDHTKDVKEKEEEVDHSKDAKEKEKEKERDHVKDVKGKDRDHSKDAKERERDRDHSKDVKERERDYNKDAKEKEKDRDYSKDAKEKDKDYSKDAKEKDKDYVRDAKEKERDYSRETKEKERDYSRDTKEKDRENPKDAKEKDRENPKDAKERDRENSRDAKERDRDYAKDSKERDKDYAKDAKEKDRDYAKDREKDHLKDAKDRERDYTKDSKERDRDHLKDLREREKDYPKDVKERDAKERDAKEREPKERDRDHHKEVKDRDREYYKEDRDRDHHKDVKDRDRENYKDAKERDKDYPKDARERNRDYTRDTKERDKDYKDPRDRDREYYRDPRERDRDYKDARERDRGSERDKRVQDARHERSDDLASRKQASKISTSGDEHGARKNTEIAGGKTQDGLRNSEPDKELDKSIRRRDGSGDKARYVGDVRDNDDRRFSSRDDHTKNSSHKDEGQREGRYRDRYREDLDRDQRDHDDRVRDEHSSREHNSKSGSKHFRDENRFPEGHYKKTKIQETDHGTSPYIDDHGAKPRVTKELHDDVEKYGKLDPRSDRGRIDYLHADKVDSSLGRPKSSPSAGNHTMKDQFRASSKQGGSSGRVPSSEEKLRLNTASRGDNIAASGFHERDPEAWSSEKRRPKEGFRSAEAEHVAHYDRTTKSDARPSHLAQKSPSTGSDRRFPDRAGPRRSFDIEGHKSNSAKHGRDYLNTNRGPFEKSMSNDHFRGEKFDSEPNPSGLPPFNRSSYLPGSSPGQLPPPPVIGHVTGGPSLLGTYEDDNRVQSGDRKPSSRFRRSGEHGMGRGQGNAWKSPSTWQSPVANGFMSLQHGSPHPGFHPSVQQFTSPLYGVTPSMELNHPYMHDAPDRFANHVRPFGWHNPMDDCPPRMPVWDGRNGGFVDDPHMYGRPEWDMNRQIMNNRGWEMTPDMWKGQNGNMNMELPVPQESEYSVGSEAWNGQAGPQSHKDRDTSECVPTVNSEVKQSYEKSPVKTGVECPQKNLHEKTTEPAKPTVPETTANGSGKILVCCNYLSKLDISLDLAQSDLYEECISLLGTKDKADLDSNISKEENAQNKEGGLFVAAQSRNNILSSVFPSGTDDVFQRAMSLYKKHSGRKVKANSTLALSYCAEQKGSSEVDEQTTSVDTPIEDKMIVDNQTSSEGSLAKADSASSFGEGKSTPIDRETCGPIEAMDQQSIADAVHFVEGSQTCETIMAECRVNVSRIHLSPGSTH